MFTKLAECSGTDCKKRGLQNQKETYLICWAEYFVLSRLAAGFNIIFTRK
jgi:hypothetical protein